MELPGRQSNPISITATFPATNPVPDGETCFQLEVPQTGQYLRGHRLDTGRSPVGIFVHGFRSHCDGEKSRGLLKHAAQRNYSWIRFDQRGHVESDGKFHDFTVSGAVTDLMAVIDSLAGRRAILVGSSLGGLVSLWAASRRPSRIAGLLLLAPAVRFFERHFESLPPDALAAWCRHDSIAFPDLYAGGHYTLGYRFFRDAAQYRLPAVLSLPCPVSILHGERDELLPPTDSAELAGALSAPVVCSETVAGADHRLSNAIPLLCRRLDHLWRSLD